MRHSDIVKTGSRSRTFEASRAHSARAIPRVASSSGATVIGIPPGGKDSPDALAPTPNAMDQARQSARCCPEKKARARIVTTTTTRDDTSTPASGTFSNVTEGLLPMTCSGCQMVRQEFIKDVIAACEDITIRLFLRKRRSTFPQIRPHEMNVPPTHSSALYQPSLMA
ncbi:hypothetical protein BGY98DRAFT_1026614 [Russula aff. rugulosa BPL654]|nr:hypothetical protein BGY98DRAFT_1026614 [Russula aff. rugulosa BPL654]